MRENERMADGREGRGRDEYKVSAPNNDWRPQMSMLKIIQSWFCSPLFSLGFWFGLVGMGLELGPVSLCDSVALCE